MPPKKQVQVIIPIENNTHFEQVVQYSNTLSVVDAYPKWCGPVKAVIPLFKRLKIESGNDKLLNFCNACIDDILPLEPYKDTIPEPLFLFYSSGVLVDRLRGCNGPVLEKKILENLKLEHKIQDSEEAYENAENPETAGIEKIERKPIPNFENEKYKHLSAAATTAGLPDSRLLEQVPADQKLPAAKDYTFGIIKPGAFEHMDEIMQILADNQITVKKRLETTLSAEQAARLYYQHADSEHYDELIEYMTSSDSCLLLLEADANQDLIIKFREIVGPFDLEAAKEQSPDSIRAKYGTSTLQNAIHAADSNEAAARELAFFFPDTEIVDSTVLILKNELIDDENKLTEIINLIWEAGFVVASRKSVKLTADQILGFYGENFDRNVAEAMSENECCVLLLTSVNAVKNWEDKLSKILNSDPEAETEGEDSVNAVNHQAYSSSTHEHRDRDIGMFFPEKSPNVSYGIIKPHLGENSDELMEFLQQTEGLEVQMSKEIELTDEIFEQIYGEHSDKEYFENLKNLMTSSKSHCVLVVGGVFGYFYL